MRAMAAWQAICCRVASCVSGEDALALSLDVLGARDFIFGRSTTIPSTIYDIITKTPVPQLPSKDFLQFRKPANSIS